MASERSIRAGEAFKRRLESDPSLREACERLSGQLPLLAEHFNQAAAATRDELRKRQLKDIDPFTYDGLIQLAFYAGVDDPESRT